MSDLNDRRDIQTCREHHAHIERILTLFPLLERSASDAITTSLGALKTLLVRHLHFEDEHLYPRLMASTDPSVVATAVRFQTEMGGLAPQVLTFFERWEDTNAIAGAFADFEAQWKALRAALERRILAEDNDLYEIAETGSL